MNKKLIEIIVAIVIICAVGLGSFFIINKEDSKREKDKQSEKSNDNKTESKGKVLVVYFSAQSHTKQVATKIAENLNADLFEIVPENVYTSADLDWTNDNSRVSKEHNDESLRNIKLVSTQVENWESYDTILIGYPIWWGIAAWPVNTFVTANNFEGKNIIPFCTSASSGLGNSGKLLEELAGKGNWQEGIRFNSNASENDIKSWLEEIDMIN